MNDTERAREAQRTATNPATCCPACGTVRTPGVTHTKGDTGPEPKGMLSEWCSK